MNESLLYKYIPLKKQSSIRPHFRCSLRGTHPEIACACEIWMLSCDNCITIVLRLDNAVYLTRDIGLGVSSPKNSLCKHSTLNPDSHLLQESGTFSFSRM